MFANNERQASGLVLLGNRSKAKARCDVDDLGVDDLDVTVNCKIIKVAGPQDGEGSTLDISSAIVERDNNTITLTARASLEAARRRAPCCLPLPDIPKISVAPNLNFPRGQVRKVEAIGRLVEWPVPGVPNGAF